MKQFEKVVTEFIATRPCVYCRKAAPVFVSAILEDNGLRKISDIKNPLEFVWRLRNCVDQKLERLAGTRNAVPKLAYTDLKARIKLGVEPAYTLQDALCEFYCLELDGPNILQGHHMVEYVKEIVTFCYTHRGGASSKIVDTLVNLDGTKDVAVNIEVLRRGLNIQEPGDMWKKHLMAAACTKGRCI